MRFTFETSRHGRCFAEAEYSGDQIAVEIWFQPAQGVEGRAGPAGAIIPFQQFSPAAFPLKIPPTSVRQFDECLRTMILYCTY